MKYELDCIDESIVTLDTYNSDLNLVINTSKYCAEPLTKEGFAFMWAGARASHGAAKGRFCFEVKVIEHCDVSHLPSDEPNPHVVRVGFSLDNCSLLLGEDPLSYGYGGTGKISTSCQFKDFGPSFMAGDCILAVADMNSDLVQIGFAKNGNFIGWAYKVKKSEIQGKALYPHVLTKNCSFEVNFGQKEEPYFKFPDAVKDYTFVSCLPINQRIGGSRPPVKREDCEMIMMCGLPGAGKSVWAADYSLKNPDKKYNILGTNNIIDKMKVMGLPRKRNYAGRWDVLIQMATKCLNSMFAISSKLRRNYILDQTNVYPTAQRRKMRNFDGFKRIAVIVVPTEIEYKRRCDKRDREEGKEIPDSAVLEMKANFRLPEVSDIFEEVIFTELQREEAEKLVKQYNEEGKSALGPARKQFRPNEPLKDRKGNFSSNRGDMRDNYRNFPGDQGVRGPNAYGDNRGDYGRGSFSKHGGFNGGYEGSFGGRDNYNLRGGYGSPGGYGDRGNFDSHGGRDEYNDQRGSYEANYNSGRSRFEDKHGGGRGVYGRGSYDGNRGCGRGSFDSGRRGSYGTGRGGYGGKGNYDTQYNCDAYGIDGKEGSEGNYSTAYGSDKSFNKSSHFGQGRETFRDDCNVSENIPGGTRSVSYDYGGENNAADRFSDRSYRSNSSNEYKRGASRSRFQSGYRVALSRSGSSTFHSDTNSRDIDYSSGYSGGNTSGTEGSYSRDYGYGELKAPNESYTTRDIPSSYTAGINTKNDEPPQRFAGSNVDTGNKYSQGTGYSGFEIQTRWSSGTASSVDPYSQSSSYPQRDSMGYQGQQTYGYQSVSANVTSQQWMASAATDSAGYGSQWMQQLQNQYYSQ